MDPNQTDECPECPLCMELLEMDDIKFFPCTCGYQICRFCWHRLRTDENGLCPACRKPYTECPADYKPLTQEELQKIKQEKKQKELMRKQRVTENRKHLANVRVVQKNLVFVVGLSTRLADADALKKMEYFGKFGKIHKVVINHTTSYAGSQGPSASAYVTYQRAEDALKAISQVNNIHVDGRTLKVSLGTTKYCSHFMKNQQCPKNDCMYLHELGDEAASFTKEEMQQGKHQEFEKKLQELYLGTGSAKSGNGGLGSTGCVESGTQSTGRRAHKDSLSETCLTSCSATGPRNTNGRSAAINGTCTSNNGSNTSVGGYNTSGIQPLDSIVISPGEGWPSLHLVGSKDVGSSSGCNAGGSGCSSSSSSGVSSASCSQNSVNGNVGVSSTQSKKNRKLNAANASVTNGSNCASSPRSTPTRDHQSTGRRTRNEDSTGSYGGRSTAVRVSPCPSSTASSEGSASSFSSVLSTTPPASSYDTTPAKHKLASSRSTTPPVSSHDTTPAKHKHASSRSPLPSLSYKRNKSQSPSSPNESQHISVAADSNHKCSNLDIINFSSKRIDCHRSVETEEKALYVVEEKYVGLEDVSLRVEESSAAKIEDGPTDTLGIEDDNSYVPNESKSDPFFENIITSLSNVVDSQETALNTGTSSIASDNWELEEVNQHDNSREAAYAASGIWSCITKAQESIGDELGFDPFEETNKALAQDIIIEKEKEELQRRLHQQQQQQQHHHQQQSFHQLQLQQPQSETQNEQLGLKPCIARGTNLNAGNAARLPPPGFNGVASLHNVSNSASHNRLDMAKILPILSGINPSLGNSLSTAPPQMNGLIATRVAAGPPPGLAMLGSLSGHQQVVESTAAGGSGGNTNTLLSALENSAHTLAQQPGPPPGLTLPKQDSFAMKELENVFPAITSLNRMNSLNTLNSSNNSLNTLNPSINSFSNMNGLASLNPLVSLSSLNGGGGTALNFGANAVQQQTALSHLNTFSGMNLASAQQQAPVNSSGTNVISNLFNFSQQQQQAQQLPQQSVLHQLALHTAQKGWSGSSTGAPDLTALDPAIVSSGQLTDSRSDSPPEWLRLIETPVSAWSSLLPSHTNSAVVPQHLNSAGAALQVPFSSHQQASLLQQQHQQLAALQQQQLRQQAMTSVWPPTSPPPGFSSLSPLHRPKLPHKIDNL